MEPTQPPSIDFDAPVVATPGEVRCSMCSAAIPDLYFELNGAVACGACRAREEARATGPRRPTRLVKACLLGTLAAGLGSALYYGVRAATGYEFGLIAVVVGVLVGGAVRMGSEGRGGWMYQALAMFLTYASIVTTYIPDLVKAVRDAAPAASSTPAEPVSFLGFLFAVAAVTALVLAIPFLAGVENIIGIVIIGIGLYEAWKINRRVPLQVTGPYRVGSAASPAGTAAA